MSVTVSDVKTMHVLADAILARSQNPPEAPRLSMGHDAYEAALRRILDACADLADEAFQLASLVKALPCP